MKYASHFFRAAIVTLGCAFAAPGFAQITVKSEDFTGATSSNSWYFFNGACLTASTSAATGSPGQIPGCTTIGSSYYKENLVGGQNGGSGSAQTLPDPTGSGALRLTNGNPGGYHQNGAIVSATPFPTSEGIQITFKTITYRGDSGGAGHDGADGISFYLMDASQPAGIGAWGGSLGYSCSNSNPPYDGLVGAYLGLGVDEYGNFLNGTNLVSGYAGSNSATGDNAAFGYGYKPGRIGMRGAGSISFNLLSSLTNGYGLDPGSTGKPYYPSSLATACPAGDAYDSATNSCAMPACSSGSFSPSHASCAVCPSGETYDPVTDVCGSCVSNGGTYDTTTHQCIHVCTYANSTYNTGTGQCAPVCTLGTYTSNNGGKCVHICSTSGNWTYSSGQSKCEQCNVGDTYNNNNNKCSTGSSTYNPLASANATTANPTTGAPTTAAATTDTPSYVSASHESTYALRAVQKTCSSGHLWNYSNPASPSDAGTATLDNSANTKGILDYAPIPNAYSELSSLANPFTIANESAMKRGDATPIFYNVKITQDGLLSMSYSINGGAYQSVIKNQDINASNGPVPANVLFGLAGSTGGSTNIHEIMCFKAAPSTQSGSSTSVNEKLAAKVEAGTQAYFAFYDQNNWTGAVTANNLIDTGGVVTVNPTANWDASCALTGTTAAAGCATTGASGPSAAQGPSNRVMLTCKGSCNGTSGNTGIPFQYSNLSASQQATLNAGDSQGSNRLSFLRGDRSNEMTTLGTGLFRIRDGILGDIVDSSPIWVGPPLNPYTAAWSDRLPPNPATTLDPTPENSGTLSYAQYVAAKQTRLNVVYGGANDGFLHGFRAGSFDANGNFVNNATTPNDGKEVLAYIPNAVVRTIHNANDSTVDYSSPQYGHNFFVDATPTADDLFYGGTWHTWLVGGLGAGGAAIYALDITDPTNFSESNAASLVIGEWRSTTLSCVSTGSACASNLGNTYGTPQIRRLHNGMWGVIFGNGFNSQTGDAGIYVMTVDPSTSAKSFYYLSTGTSATGNNGIAFVSPADLDGDHITDYVYAGDLRGNVWRFDLTSTDPTNWSASAHPLFTAPSGQPITTKLQVVVTLVPGTTTPQVMLEFGTGQKTLLTNTSPTSYASGTQSLYGVWDWNFGGWNSMSSVQYRSLNSTATGLSTPYVLAKTNLQAQTFTASSTSPGNVDGTTNNVCWQGLAQCPSPSLNNSFGWYADMQTNSTTGLSEQVVFNPVFFQGAFIINSTVPANNVPTSCSVPQDSGFTYVMSATTGATFSGAFPGYGDLTLAGVATSATGTPYVVNTVEGKTNIVYQTVSGTPGAKQISVPANTKAKRLTWVELR